MTGDVLADAGRITAPFIDQRGYALAYGSHARGAAGPRSDLDVLVVNQASLDRTLYARLIENVKRLHRDHRLSLDEEVPYAVKLYACASEVAAATALGGFTTPVGAVRIPRLIASPQFLASTQFKLRLLLNALTGPHVFLAGNPGRFAHDHRRACRAITLLALAVLANHDAVSVPRAVHALVHDPQTGASGKDYLGYTDNDLPHLYGLIRQGLAHLTSGGVVQPVDGATFAQRHSARTSLIARISTPRPAHGRPIVNETIQPTG